MIVVSVFVVLFMCFVLVLVLCLFREQRASSCTRVSVPAVSVSCFQFCEVFVDSVCSVHVLGCELALRLSLQSMFP